jgi:hypothetical protein
MIALLLSVVACGGGKRAGNEGDTTPEPPAETVKYKQVVVGNTQACALREDNTVVCWGATEEEIERGTLLNYYHDGKAPAGLFVSIFISGEYMGNSNSYSGKACGIELDRETICCWGRMEHGLSSAQTCLPVLSAKDGAHFVSVVNGVTHVCGLEDSGLLTCVDDDGFELSTPNIQEIAGNGYLLDAITTSTEYVVETLNAHPCSTTQLFEDPPEPITAKIDNPKLVKGSIGCFWNAESGLIRCEDSRLRWEPGPDVVDVVGMEYTTCAIYSTGVVRCETPHEYAVDPDGVIDNWPPDPVGQFKQIALWPNSARVGCGITLDDQVSCWGSPHAQSRWIVQRAP